MIGAPGRYDPSVYADEPGGDDEVHWVRLRLREIGAESRIDYHGVRACDGATLPPPDEADGVIVGGSYHSVHDALPWQRETMAWLDRYRASGRPLLGICGGHQLIAHLSGALVGPVEGGPVAGSRGVTLTAAGRRHFLFTGFGDAPVFHFANFDHVPAAPAGATTLATGPGMPCVALDHGAGWYGVQFHPEATDSCLAASWKPLDPALMRGYRPLPEAPRLIRNFLTGTGLLG
jgi:GMP synthase-like glutamine amidotransferase